MTEKLTTEGKKLAEKRRATSIVARVALGEQNGWPASHVDTAIQAVNKIAAEEQTTKEKTE